VALQSLKFSYKGAKALSFFYVFVTPWPAIFEIQPQRRKGTKFFFFETWCLRGHPIILNSATNAQSH